MSYHSSVQRCPVALQDKDGWGVLRLRQDILGLAKVHQMVKSGGRDGFPLLLPTAHYKLAQVRHPSPKCDVTSVSASPVRSRI